MAHFAEINSQNLVLRVLVVPDEEQHRGQEFLASDLKLGGTWIQTSYNHRIRKQYAGIGFKYDANADVFIAPQPFPSWTKNEETYIWEAPVAMPTDGKHYIWNEADQKWDEVSFE